MFAFQTLGVMADAAEAIATDRDVRESLCPFRNILFSCRSFLPLCHILYFDVNFLISLCIILGVFTCAY